MRYGLALLSVFWVPLAVAQSAPASTSRESVETARSARVDKALALIKAGQPEAGLAELDQIIRDYEADYAGEKGRIFCASSPEESLQELATHSVANKGRAIAIGTTWCFALWAKGFALIDLDRLDEAVKFLERAVAMWPMRAQFHSELGYTYQMLKRPDDALASYTRAADLAERLEGDARTRALRTAWFGMGFELIELDRLDEAEAILVKCLELTPDDEKVAHELKYVRDQQEARKKKSS
ncbi:tetratricopeptide repeat protein [Sphingomonas sp. JC676]|uniref:tetratricopeptide repeat protein n=1 Tax=Sphingomonas sp. JC676 TaxID=2768065 RepID=UPI0016581F4A|nr:tetratricopeptide repeat protein [Sphingomonas sp. JC676]MBC9031475.1 tetratricopeptide repeat protein [Sphingomonas sp. JC676]